MRTDQKTYRKLGRRRDYKTVMFVLLILIEWRSKYLPMDNQNRFSRFLFAAGVGMLAVCGYVGLPAKHRWVRIVNWVLFSLLMIIGLVILYFLNWLSH